ncbi:MAG TPA: MupA/Atu3671 family FMN-dependent luciferase-like monooxygenase [Alphaproteobacteria bacterium]|nr:MupA/Atu3671 family FMN-dependent luciferase-like monooxygenase [Alphaproteobacteria bacterium]
MKFGIMFFSSDCDVEAPHSLLLDVARYADRHGFTCIWTPERHFNRFGGLFPNPSVLSAALAMITERLQLRSGSLISPLHNEIRIAEEWSLVDQLSGGRVAISFGSGWNVNDFVFFPERYQTRREIMFEQIDTIRALWQGKSITRKNSFGKDVQLSLYPKPVQADLPIWVTSSGNADTFREAGYRGANVLTHMITQDIYDLKEKIGIYRRARLDKGFDPLKGIVSLMLHTFLGKSVEDVKASVYHPFREYLRSAIDLEQLAAQGGGVISGGFHHKGEPLPPDKLEELLDLTFERYFDNAALMGTVASTARFLQKLEVIGVDEIACLVDFGVGKEHILASLEHLVALQERFDIDA